MNLNSSLATEESPTIRCTSPAELSFSLVATEVITSSNGGETEEEQDDCVYSVASDADTLTEAQITVSAESGSFDPPSFRSLRASIATVDDEGNVSRVADGNARIAVKCRSGAKALEKHITVPVSLVEGVEARSFSHFKTGTLARALVDGVDSRIAGKNSSENWNIFSTINNTSATYVRDPDCFLHGLDLTAISIYQDWFNNVGNPLSPFALTLVAPDIAIGVQHVTLSNGTNARWVANDGTVVTRQVLSSETIYRDDDTEVPEKMTDIQVYRLSSDAPESITPVKVMPANMENYFGVPLNNPTGQKSWWHRIPTVGTNRQKQALVQDWYLRATGDFGINPYIGIYFTTPIDEQRNEFHSHPVPGDSGNPVFFIAGDEMVFLGPWTGHELVHGTYILHDEINASMTRQGSEYQLTDYDLSGFTDFS